MKLTTKFARDKLDNAYEDICWAMDYAKEIKDKEAVIQLDAALALINQADMRFQRKEQGK
jgi:hypothetical protein